MAPIPGGPEDHTPPQIVRVTPDTNAVNFHGGAVDFRFDGVVSDRSGPTQDLNGLFLISPRDGAPRVNWHRDHIDVRPQRDWRPNTTYTVTLLPGLADLSNNITKYSFSLVFSTGPSIPRFGILGRVFDWSAQRVAPKAIVEAIQRIDSTATQRADSIVYVNVADSTGQFHLGPLPAGRYAVVAFLDRNQNFKRDVGELWDSTRVDITDAQPYLEMLAAQRDTIGPEIAAAEEVDSVTIRVTFDKPLNPDAAVDRTHFRVTTADSTTLAVVSARTLAQYQADREKARNDSAATADSLAALRDTTRRPVLPGRRPQPTRPGAGAAEAIKPSRPAPSTEVMIQLALGSRLAPLTTVRVTATDMSNLLGYRKSSTRVFATPAAPSDSAKRDTSRVRTPPDTGRRVLLPHPTPGGSR